MTNQLVQNHVFHVTVVALPLICNCNHPVNIVTYEAESQSKLHPQYIYESAGLNTDFTDAVTMYSWGSIIFGHVTVFMFMQW
jgi:hypothetical protein